MSATNTQTAKGTLSKFWLTLVYPNNSLKINRRYTQMDKALIDAIEFVKKYKALNAAGIYAVRINGDMHVQVQTNILKDLPGVKLKNDRGEHGYYELSTYIDGVEVLALPTLSELEKHFPHFAKEVLDK